MAAARQRLLPRFALTAVAAAALIIAVGRAHAADPAAGSLVMGPQAMEGDLKVSPGTTLLVGYDFTIPGRHPDTTVGVWGASVGPLIHLLLVLAVIVLIVNLITGRRAV